MKQDKLDAGGIRQSAEKHMAGVSMAVSASADCQRNQVERCTHTVETKCEANRITGSILSARAVYM